MTYPGKNPINSAASGGILNRTLGYVVGVDGTTATVTLKTAGQTTVDITNRMGKGPAPAVGETWLLDKTYGTWVFVYQTLAPVPAWINATLLGAWTNNGTGVWTSGTNIQPPIGYYKTMEGEVKLRGAAASGSASFSNAEGPLAGDIFQLPDGYQPSDEGLYNFQIGSNTIVVYPDGFVRLLLGGPTVYLNQISFMAAQ